MTRIVGDIAGNSEIIGIDMNSWDFGEMAAATITAHTDKSVTFTANDHTYTLQGHDFTFDTTGGTVKVTGGTMTRFTVTPTAAGSAPDFTILRFKMEITRFNDLVAHNDIDGFQHDLFGKVDGYRGGASIDILNGMGGGDFISGGDANDQLYGGKGDDELQGDRGADHLYGGKGDDRFYFVDAGDSGNGVYDTVHGFNTNQDRFMCSIVVEGVETAVDTSATQSASFEDGLTAALAGDHLNAYNAAAATIASGGTTHVFLVVDLNGVTGYQSGADLAVIVDGSRDLNTLAIDNFILLSQH